MPRFLRLQRLSAVWFGCWLGLAAVPALAQSVDTGDVNNAINNALQTAKGLSGVSDVSVDIAATARPGTYDCGGHNARISGGQNHLTLKHCGTIAIMGGQNTITAIAPQALRIYGSNNTVTWTGDSKPAIDNRGSYNAIVHR